MNVSKTIGYVGVDDFDLDLFEGQYPVPNGMAYNSYVVCGEKIAVMDSVDGRFSAQWLQNIATYLEGKSPDYLVVQHMEPDHSGSVVAFMQAYPNAKIVSSGKAFIMMKGYFGTDFAGRNVVVGEGDALDLGNRTLTFYTAPMVHWPEVIVTYDDKDKILFSADAFGKFGALSVEEDWACEARRYYFGIVGKYGVQASALLKKAGGLDVEKICPLHGPVLEGDLSYYLDLYRTWTSYGVESEGIFIAYTSVYGNTERAVKLLVKALEEKGQKVVLTDLARSDMSEAVEDAFRYGKIVLATTTYNGGVFPFMREFLSHLAEHNFQNRRVALIENGSWAPMAAKEMKKLLEGCKNLCFAETTVKILCSLNEESLAQLNKLADELCK
ncbi:MAG: FprA family A-type flavoprotein [Clostridia bacterium]|nr:FprA family A-type flavoprotein [Clostridia bacterium]